MSDSVELLEALESLGLVAVSQTEVLRREWTDNDSISKDEATSRLLQRNLITPFQAERLSIGDASSLVLGERYQIQSVLGEGGMGTVYLAKDIQLGRSVALKVLPPTLVRDHGAVARFEREARAMAHLTHNNIVQAYDSGSDGDQHYLVMEHVEGTNLSHILKHRGAIESAVAADYAYQTAVGLSHAHQKGLVHRDLKPANLIVKPDNQVKILDLGLARFLQDQIADDTLTVDGAGLGTPDYMAPEQFSGARHSDERSDVYSLGCTLYHMLAGRVPFPGSSLSEKQAAHHNSDPEAVHHFAKGIPTGLSQAVGKMMAKRPADRFQSACECSEALLPYVDASSDSLPDVQASTEWRGSQFTIANEQSRHRRRLTRSAIGTMLILISVAFAFALPKMWNQERSSFALGSESAELVEKVISPVIDDEISKVTSVEPWVLTVSKDASAGGHYRSINEALQDAQPGMTVRIVDSEIYEEQLTFADRTRHEGVTLDATKHATLKAPHDCSNLIAVNGVPNIRISNLVLEDSDVRGQEARCLIRVQGDSPGLRVERTRFRGKKDSSWLGVGMEGPTMKSTAKPMIIESCRFDNLTVGVRISATGDAPSTPLPVRGVIVRENVMSNCDHAVSIAGHVTDIQVVGNLLTDFKTAGISISEFAPLVAGSSAILIANNTIGGERDALSIKESTEKGCGVQIHNNLLLAEMGPDIGFAGQDASALADWKISNNVRRVLNAPSESSTGWVLSPNDSDTFVTDVKLVSIAPQDPTQCHRPTSDSVAATGGAGGTEPSLPGYVGAFPPPGVDSWDWHRTWLAPPGTSELLTVTQDPEDGGRFRKINEALRSAKPWATIRVLDNATYAEAFVLNDAAAHEGIVLEAANRATLMLSTAPATVVDIRNVPDARVTGFRISSAVSSMDSSPLVRASGRVAGLTLRDLHLSAMDRHNYGIVLSQPHAPVDKPAVVRGCSLQLRDRGIIVSGSLPENEDPPSGAWLVDNHIIKAKIGILIQGTMGDCLIAGNTVGICSYAGIQTEDPWGSRNLLIANNTCFGSSVLFRVWSNELQPSVGSEKVRLLANVFFDPVDCDLTAFVAQATGEGLSSIPVTRELGDHWHFSHNLRQMTGTHSLSAVPLSVSDKRLDDVSFVSRDPLHADYLRPTGNLEERLATAGIGGDMPGYAGAIAPQRVAQWNWDVTWRSRTHQTPIDAPEDASQQ